MPTRNGPYQNRARIEWSWTVSSINQSTSSVTVTVTAYLRMQSNSSIAGNWPVSWSGSWGNSSNTQGISLGGGQRQQIRRSSFTVSLTDSSQSRSVAISVAHYWGTTSNTLNISIGARYARTPTNLLVNRVNDNRIDLSWGRVGTYSSVNVQMQSDTGSGWSTGGTATVSGNANSYSSTGRIANRRYRFRVRGRTSGGASAWTGWSTIVYTTPSTPSAPSAARSGNNIRVSLGSNTSLFGTHFDVQDDATGTTVGSAIPRGSFPWTHSNPNQSVRHRYRIRARRAQYSTGGTVLTSSYSSWSSWVELQSPPSAPTGLSPNGGSVELDAAVTLRWSHNPVDSSDQSQYELRHRLGSTGSWATLSGTTASTRSVTFDEPGLHQWQVRTRGAHPDWSPWSAVANLTAVTAPSVGLVTPDGESWMLPTMQVEWDFTQDDGLPQQGWRVELFSTDSDDEESLIESREGSTSASSVTLNTRLVRDGHYRVQVSVQSNGVWSEPVDQAFQVTFIPPSPPVLGGEWDEETGSVGLTVVDGRGPEIDDIVNVFPNPRFRTEGDRLNISRVNGHQNPGARYGGSNDIPGFAGQGSTQLYPSNRVDVGWSDSGSAAEFWTSSDGTALTRIMYGPMLEELADVLGLPSIVGETVTIEWQWVRPTVGATRSVTAPVNRQGGTTIPHDARGRSSNVAEPIAGNVYTDWITFTVTPLESGYLTRNVSVTANGTSSDHRIQVSNVKMYVGEYDQTVEWFDGDSEATGDHPIYWNGEPGESVSLEATPTPKHVSGVDGTVVTVSAEGAEAHSATATATVQPDTSLFTTGQTYTVITEARVIDGENVTAQWTGGATRSVGEEWTPLRWTVTAGDMRAVFESETAGVRVQIRHLTIVPVELTPLPDGQQNLCTNPSFEAGTDDWVAVGSSISTTTDPVAVAVGTQALHMQNVGGSSGTAYVYHTSVDLPGEHTWYAARFEKLQSTAGTATAVRTGVLIDGAYSYDPIFTHSAERPIGQGESVTVSREKGDATTVRLLIYIQATAGVSGLQPFDPSDLYLDGVTIATGATESEALAAVEEYRDGDSPGWAWAGTPHESESFEAVGQYDGPSFDGSTESAVIEGSSLTGVWDGEPDDSPSRLTMSEATVSVDIHRSVDGGETWEPVFGGDYDDELHVSDFESLSNGTTLYRATGYSLNGEPADTITEVVSDSTALWLGAGETFDATARLPLDPDVNINRTRLRQLEQYEGRALGVAYSSANQTREVTFAGTVPDADIGIPSATRTELDDVSLNPWPVHLYRDPAGNRVYGIAGPIDMQRIGTEATGNTFWSYSGSLQETEK